MIGMGIRTLVNGDGIETKSVSITSWFTQDVFERIKGESKTKEKLEMGRHKKIPAAPGSIGEYVKHNTDWKLMVQHLTRLAVGTDAASTDTQTNLEALRLLFLFAWGKEYKVGEMAVVESFIRNDSGMA